MISADRLPKLAVDQIHRLFFFQSLCIEDQNRILIAKDTAQFAKAFDHPTLYRRTHVSVRSRFNFYQVLTQNPKKQAKQSRTGTYAQCNGRHARAFDEFRRACGLKVHLSVLIFNSIRKNDQNFEARQSRH